MSLLRTRRLEVLPWQREELVAAELVMLKLRLAVGEELGHLDAFVH